MNRAAAEAHKPKARSMSISAAIVMLWAIRFCHVRRLGAKPMLLSNFCLIDRIFTLSVLQILQRLWGAAFPIHLLVRNLFRLWLWFRRKNNFWRYRLFRTCPSRETKACLFTDHRILGTSLSYRLSNSSSGITLLPQDSELSQSIFSPINRHRSYLYAL